ncbi:MAG TPA: hypothetical protein VJL58_10690, partial [Pyrinomonadaceae bacterium]|nr:hypothetical protein [Pyrinomonadaceae bacterium]
IHEGGFFTTRFVEAHSQESACAKVIGEVLTDLNASGMLTEESRIEVIKIVQPDVLFDRHAPGDGYVFYTGDGRQTALDIESGAF